MHAPLKYSPEDKLEKSMVTFKTNYDGENYRENIAIYENGTREDLPLTIQDFIAMNLMYKLWTNSAALNIYGKFRRCLKGEIHGYWDEIIDGEPKDDNKFGEQLIHLVVVKLGLHAHKHQAKYLRRTKKLSNILVQKWFKRIFVINQILPLLSGVTKYDDYLLENVVLENILKDWRIQAKLKGLDENTDCA